MIGIVAVALLFAGGVWLLVGALWPAPEPLAVALRRLHRSGWGQSDVAPAVGGATWVASLGRWVVRHARAGALADEQTASDLALLDRSLDLFAGTSAFCAIAGLLVGPAIWAAAAVTGTPLPIALPLWLMIAGAVLGWIVPRTMLRSEATRARRDFRHALGAYLDVLVLLLAAHEGTESAMDLAAGAGTGPAFAELRRAVSQARLSGDPVWDQLDELGRRIRVPELGEIAATGSLAGESGAAVRRSLTAKARALRTAALAEAETTARRKSQAMFAPLVLMGLGFVLFLIYPLVTNLSIGGAR